MAIGASLNYINILLGFRQRYYREKFRMNFVPDLIDGRLLWWERSQWLLDLMFVPCFPSCISLLLRGFCSSLTAWTSGFFTGPVSPLSTRLPHQRPPFTMLLLRLFPDLFLLFGNLSWARFETRRYGLPFQIPQILLLFWTVKFKLGPILS